MKSLLDPCVISELVTKHPNPKVVDFVDSLDSDDVYLSVITIGEIAKGVEKMQNRNENRNCIPGLRKIYWCVLMEGSFH